MDKKFRVSLNPHIRSKENIQKIMFSVIISLLPALFASYWFFGIRAIFLTLVAIVSAILSEIMVQKLRKVPITVSDGSAILTGMLLAFNVPANIPWWILALGSCFAIIIAKHTFGGLGYNPFNPALAGRAFMLASWPVQMTSNKYWTQPLGKLNSYFFASTNQSLEAISSATPLNAIKQNLARTDHSSIMEVFEKFDISYWKLFIGDVSGCIGETSFLALLIGAIYLLYKGYINWRVPVIYIGTVFILTLAIGQDPLFHILAGGLALGAFYMATDMVTSPLTGKGMIIFAIGLGILTFAIRIWGGYPEGVSYSILLMNCVVPLIDRYTVPKRFGYVTKKEIK